MFLYPFIFQQLEENCDTLVATENHDSPIDNVDSSVQHDETLCENETPGSESIVEVNYLFHEGSDPCLTHFDSSQFKKNDCYTKGCKWSVNNKYCVYINASTFL